MVLKKKSKPRSSPFKAKRYSPTDPLEHEAINVLKAILGFEYIHYLINEGDKIPNHDGNIELCDINKDVVGMITVQVKKIPNGSKKYSLKASTLEYGLNRCTSPFFIFCVDIKNKVLYWRFITKEIVIKKGNKSKTIHFKNNDLVNKRNSISHIRKWIEIVKQHIERTQNVSKGEAYKGSVALQHPAMDKTLSSEILAIGKNEEGKYKKDIEKAKVLLDSEKFDSAMHIYEKILPKIERDHKVMNSLKFKVHTNIANCQYVLGNDSAAINNYKIAFGLIDVKSDVAYKNRALASLLEDKPLEAILFIDEAIKLKRSIENLNFKATLLREAGLYDEMLKLYDEVANEK